VDDPAGGKDGWGKAVACPLAFLHLVADGERAGQRTLDRLHAAAARRRGRAANVDRRSRLPDAVEALVRVPVLTPKALAARLKAAPQTAPSLMRELQVKGLVKELTARESFRAVTQRRSAWP
jgi:hypothetical protein